MAGLAEVYGGRFPLAIKLLDDLVPEDTLLPDIPEKVNPELERRGIRPISGDEGVEESLARIDGALAAAKE